MAMKVIFGGQSITNQHVDLSEPVLGEKFFDTGIPSHQAALHSAHHSRSTQLPTSHLEALYDLHSTTSAPQQTSATDFDGSYNHPPVRMADFVADFVRCKQTCHEDFVDAGIKPPPEREPMGQ